MDASTHQCIDCNQSAANIFRYGSPHEVIGKTPEDFAAPVQYDGTPSSQKAAFFIHKAMQDGSVIFEWKHRRPDGEFWDAEVHLQRFDADGTTLLQLTLVDITIRKRAERMQRLAHDLVLELNSCRDFQEGLQIILSTVLLIEPLDVGAIYIVDQEDGTLKLQFHQGLSPEFVERVSHFNDDSAHAFVVRKGQAHYGAYSDIRPGTDPVRERENLLAFASIPISAQGRHIALLHLASKVQGDIPASSRSVLETIASQIGVSLQRLRSETALRASEEKYRALFSTMAQGVIYQDAQGKVIDANPAAVRILGLTLEQMQGCGFLDPCWTAIKEDGTVFPAGEHPIFMALHTGKEVRDLIQGAFNPVLNKQVWITVNAVPLFRNGETRPWRAYATLEDITERITTQKELERVQILLDQTIEQSPVPMALASAEDSQFKIINKAAEDFLQIRASDYLNKAPGTIDIVWQEFSPDGKRIPVSDLPMPRALRGLATSNTEMMVTRRDSSIVWQLASGVPIHDATGRLLAGLLVMQDITERKRFEEKVLRNERRFRELIRNSSDSITILAADGTQLFVSDVVERMLGFKPAELLNIPVMDTMIHPEDRERVHKAFARLLTSGEVVTEYRHLRKDGSWADLEAWGTNQLNNPDIRGVVLNVRDITDRKRTQDALNNVQKLEALGVLAAGIAHDFNNLMGGLFGYIDLALSSCTERKVFDCLEKAGSAIDRARGLTHQLLTFSKGGAPVQKITPLFPFVQETVHFALSGSNVSCLFEVAADLHSCSFDKNQIGQVIDNVIINAQQAMPLGGTLDVGARNVRLGDEEHPLLAGGDYVKLSVRDRGIGIPPELLSRIFDPFFTTKPRGHGLGLATCYSIMKRHGGCIDVESTPGQGSVFHLYLPVASLPGVPSEGLSGDCHKGSGTILVMDDEEVIRATISGLLKTLGYDAVCVTNGKSAVEYVTRALQESNLPVALIFDLTVQGGMGGQEAIAEIRKLACTIPAFVVSGYADDPVMRNPTEYGFLASLCKPFIRSELMELFEKHLPK